MAPLTSDNTRQESATYAASAQRHFLANVEAVQLSDEVDDRLQPRRRVLRADFHDKARKNTIAQLIEHLRVVLEARAKHDQAWLALHNVLAQDTPL